MLRQRKALTWTGCGLLLALIGLLHHLVLASGPGEPSRWGTIFSFELVGVGVLVLLRGLWLFRCRADLPVAGRPKSVQADSQKPPELPSRPLDAALAFLALAPVLLAPAYFFGRIEVAREAGRFQEWRGIAVSHATVASGGSAEGLAGTLAKLPAGATGDLRYAFAISEGATDEFGIATPGRMVAVTPDGKAADLSKDLASLVREASGRVRSAGSGAGQCSTTGEGEFLVCGAASGTTMVAGVILAPQSVDFGGAAGWLALLLAGLALAVWLACRLLGEPRFWLTASVAAGLAGLGGGLLLTVLGLQRIGEFAAVSEAVAATVASGQVLAPAASFGAGFVAILAVATAGIVVAAHRSASKLFANLRDRPFLYVSIAPAMLGMVLLIFVPFFMGVYLAFLDNDRNFVGLANFGDILFPSQVSDTDFYLTLNVTVLWTGLNVFLHVAIGLALALVLSDAKLRGKAVYRVLLVVPWAVPNYITALIWKWIFGTTTGPVNAFLALAGATPVDWLGQSFVTNFAANLATNTWLGFPFMMIVSLGALQSIPADLYEAEIGRAHV